jgi:magnesium transporter
LVKQDIPGTNNNGSNGEPKYKRWFFVAVSNDGSLQKIESDTPDAFFNKLSTSAVAWIDLVTHDEFENDVLVEAPKLGFSEPFLSHFVSQPRLGYYDVDTELGLKLPSIQVNQLDVNLFPLLILLKKNFIFTAHPANVDRRFTFLRRYSETFLKKIPRDAPLEDKVTMILLRIIDHNNERNFEHLRQIDERGDHLNQLMADPTMPRDKLAPQIYVMKHALIVYLNALWDTLNVLHTLHYGDAELLTDDDKLLDRLLLSREDVNRQISLAEHMSDVLASGLEVLQSIYNNQLQNLNNRLALIMTYLTIIGTAVLVPNTLATILGSFNVGVEDLFWYIPLMVGSTVLATWVVYYWVKKRGWIPGKLD